MRFLDELQAALGADRHYVIPTDLYDQMLVLSDRRKRGEDVDAECRALIRVLHERRSELGCIIKLRGSGLELHIGVRR